LYMARKQQQRDLQRWIDIDAKEAYRKHLACVDMIQRRSVENQQACKDVEILAAYYGVKN
jgi:hypothetical protein